MRLPLLPHFAMTGLTPPRFNLVDPSCYRESETADSNGSMAAEALVNIEDYRRRLLAREQELLERVGREIGTAREAREDQGDVGDASVADELKEEYFAIAETDSAILTQVRAALKRIDDGTFGRCAVDGGAIEERRLEAVPWTPYCLKHQQELEEQARLRTPSL
jgi:DnaK suppressor protein